MISKKAFLFFLGLGVVLIAGCAQQSEVDALKEQNELLKQQVTIKDQQQNQLKKEQDEQALENQKEKDNFDSNLKCQERGDVLRKTFSNFHSAYYNQLENTCYVRVYNDKTNQLDEMPMDHGGSAINTPLSPDELLEKNALYGTQIIKRGVNLRTAASPDAALIQKIDPTNTVYIVSHEVVNGELRYEIDFDGDKHGWISHLAFDN